MKENKRKRKIERICNMCGSDISLSKKRIMLCSVCRNIRDNENNVCRDAEGAIGGNRRRNSRLVRWLVKQYINRKLKKEEVVHHIDGDWKNNNLKNFYVFNSSREHMRYHGKLERWAIRFPFISLDEAKKTYPYLESNIDNFKK